MKGAIKHIVFQDDAELPIGQIYRGDRLRNVLYSRNEFCFHISRPKVAGNFN